MTPPAFTNTSESTIDLHVSDHYVLTVCNCICIFCICLCIFGFSYCLIINFHPPIPLMPTSHDGKFPDDSQEGNSTTLVCTADGIPRPTIKWSRKDGMPLPLAHRWLVGVDVESDGNYHYFCRWLISDHWPSRAQERMGCLCHWLIGDWLALMLMAITIIFADDYSRTIDHHVLKKGWDASAIGS